jgi:hypothetical protein
MASHTRYADLWHEAETIRNEWLEHGLSTQPADRAAAERALAGIYARIGRPPPRFEWTDSPAKALPLIAGLPTLADLHRWVYGRHPQGTPPLASDLAALVSRLRSALGEGVDYSDPELSPPRQGKRKEPWPEVAPFQAWSAGLPLAVLLHRGVRRTLQRSLGDGLYLPVRAALAREGDPLPVCWYGQQDASWIAYYDMLQRVGLATYSSGELGHFGEWAALARSCGWWWPGEQLCVVVERPAALAVQAQPGATFGEVRAVGGGFVYRDGWQPA